MSGMVPNSSVNRNEWNDKRKRWKPGRMARWDSIAEPLKDQYKESPVDYEEMKDMAAAKP